MDWASFVFEPYLGLTLPNSHLSSLLHVPTLLLPPTLPPSSYPPPLSSLLPFLFVFHLLICHYTTLLPLNMSRW